MYPQSNPATIYTHNPQSQTVDDWIVPIPVPRHLSDSELREWLLDKMNEIDSIKRQIRDQLSRFSHETRNKTQHDFIWVRKAKGKIGILTEERERLRKLLGDVNHRIKQYRITKNTRQRPSPELAQCFMMLAEELLDQDTYLTIENKALNMVHT